MPTYGRAVLQTTGRPVRVAASSDAEQKVGGVTIDWTTVVPAAAPATLADDTPVVTGQYYLLFGTVLAKITATGKYGPALTTATDGRQTLVAGECFILNETTLRDGILNNGFGAGPADNPGVIEGGHVWKDRLQVGGAGQPTLAAVMAVLPRLQLVEMT